jgi:hypothetical protein
VPYELSFTKAVGVRDREQYINECCIGGDVVRDALLPLVSSRYEDVQTEQEDWGWFIWFRKGPVRLAIDIFTDDPEIGAFRIHLTSRVKRFLGFERVVDSPELDALRDTVIDVLSAWAGRVSCEAIPSDEMG